VLANPPVQSGEGKTDQNVQSPPQQAAGLNLIALLDARDGADSLSTLQDIRITNAALTLFDDANSASWVAPSADLTFRKMPYGFVVLAKADVASSGAPWHTEFSIAYKHDTKTFNVSSTVDNLILANVADKIFALSQFAKIKLPLSGHIDFDATENGVITKANAELQAASGQLDFPDYLAEPIVVDDGTLRASYEAAVGSINVTDSSFRVGGERADISGKILPIRTADGKLTALNINLLAKNVSLEQDGTDKKPVLVDRIEFAGRAAIDQARLDIDDLVIMSANTGVRMRGIITDGVESAGIQIAGRVRDISAPFLKKLWPPIVATDARAWVIENVIKGKVSEGTFQVNFPAGALAKAKRDLRLAHGSVDLTFKLDDVSTHFFKNLPPLVKASGVAHLKDNDFDLAIAGGQTKSDSGRIVTVSKGSFAAHDIAKYEVQGIFAFDLEAPVDAMLELANQPEVGLAKTDLSKLPKVQGTAHAAVGLQIPLINEIPKDRIQLTTDISLTNAALAGVVPGIDVTEGEFAIAVSKDEISVIGPAKVNGLSAKINWKKTATGTNPSAQISLTLDEKTREKMKMKLAEYISGDVPIIATISENDAHKPEVSIEADMSKVKMKLAALGWKRDAVDNTKASFKVVSNPDGSRKIQDFVLDGDGLHLNGSINVGSSGKMTSITMDEIRLDEDNAFSAKVVAAEGGNDFTIAGKNFDARPYIQNVMSPLKKPNDTTSPANSQDFTLNAHFDHITANRGEAIDDVTAIMRVRGGRIAAANIQGHFLSGQPVSLNVTPLPNGRDVRVKTSDAGAAIRAANFYSKIAGGELEFSALVGNEPGSPLRNGQVLIHNFEVRNEAALAELDKRGTPRKSGPRAGGLTFSQLAMPFTIDDNFIRIGDTVLRGTDMCATASGVVRKSDSRMDITGTVIPVCGISGVFNNVPIVGELLAGGNNNEGLFGMTYALGGVMAKPNIQFNPISVLAPGIFRRFFDFKQATPRNKVPVGTKQEN
jgi:hypothetical protein